MSKYTDPDPQLINEPQLMGEYTFPMYPINYALLKSDPEMLKGLLMQALIPIPTSGMDCRFYTKRLTTPSTVWYKPGGKSSFPKYWKL